MNARPDMVRVSILGDAGIGYRVKQTFEKTGLATRWAGSSPVETRGAQQVAEWFGVYVVGAVVDETVGSPVRRSVRATVDLVVADLRRRCPNITIRIED